MGGAEAPAAGDEVQVNSSEASSEVEPREVAIDPAAPPSEPLPETREGEEPALSDEEADRFAATIRASWDPPPNLQPATTDDSRAQGMAGGEPPGLDAAAEDAGPVPLVSALPGARQRLRALWLAALSVLGFAALGAWALLSPSGQPVESWRDEPRGGTTEAPPRALGGAEAQREPVERAAAVEPTQAPAAAPEPLVETAAAVAEATESAETTAAEVAAEPAPAPVAEAAAPEASNKDPEPEPEPRGNTTVATAPRPVPSRAPAAPATTTAPQAPASALAKAPERTPSTVRVRVATRPANASLTLDGKPVVNPYDARVERRGERKRFEAQAPGYRSRSIELGFERDQDVTLRLRRERRREPVASPPPSPPSRNPARKGAGFVTESPY